MKPRVFFLASAVVALLTSVWAVQKMKDSHIPEKVEENREVTETSATEIGGNFTLVNSEGAEVSSESLKGKMQLIYFGFTACPAVCPTDLANISHVLKRLGSKADKIQTIFITVDPERDTPEVMKKYMEAYDSRILALTGTAEQIAVAAKAYKVYYKKMEAEAMPGGYTMDHSAFTYVMDESGKYLTHFAHDEDIITMEQTLQKYLQQ